MRQRITTTKRKEIQQDYDEKFLGGGYENPVSFVQFVLDTIRRNTDSRTPQKLLDVACGNGNFLALAEQSYHTYGVDISKEAIMQARRRATRTNLSVGTAERIRFPNKFFDIVTCLGSLEHFVDMNASLREMKRVLKPAGLAIIHVPNSRYLVHRLLGIETHGQIIERFATKSEWTALLEPFFTVKKTYKYNTRWCLSWIPLSSCCHFTFVCKNP